MKKIIFISLLLLTCIFGFNKEARATHVAGGYIQFECTGTPGVYKVRVTLYRDCSGIQLNNTSLTVNLTNNCSGVSNTNVKVNRISEQEVSQVCDADQGNTRCNGGTIPGFQEVVFEGTISLADCDTWTASYNLAARNTITNVSGANSTNFYVTTQINTATDNCNTSPTVTAQPIPYVCRNTPISYNLGASEPNGDSIVYSLVDAIRPNGTSLNYTGGASGAVPIPGTTINPLSGTVTFTPTQLGNYIFVIQMTEYNDDNEVVTVTNYEYQVNVIDCDNIPPVVPIDDPNDMSSGVTNVSGSLVQLGPNQLKLCKGFEGCFDVVFSDNNAGDALSVTSNLQNVLPGAIITETGTNPLTVSVCWTPPSVMGVVNLSFLVEDDACPLTGQNNYAVTINVVEAGEATVTTVTEQCGGTDEGEVTFNMTSGEPPYIYNITGPVNNSTAQTTNTTHTFTNLPPGNYNYAIETKAGCSVIGNFVINPGPDLPLTANGTDISCNGENDGSATAQPTGGAAPYTYQWTQGGTSLGLSTQTIDNLSPGTYNVTATDANGCFNDVDVTINEPAPITATLNPTAVLCFGEANGSIDVVGTSGGTAPYTYSLNGGGFQTGTSFTGLSAGNYIVTIKDDNGCTFTLNTTVTEPSSLNFTIDVTADATCGGATGSFKVNASGGQGPYTYTDGVTTNSNGQFNNMPPGTYTISVTDGNGCTDNVTVVVDAIPEPVASIESVENLSCFGGNDGQVVVSVANAAPPLTYSINGGTPQSSNQFTNLPAGNHTIEVTDNNGCTDVVSVTITQPDVLSYTTSVTPASCSGDCDGEIQIVATGGTMPYQYSSNNGMLFDTNPTISGICAGVVNLVVKDDNGCLTNSTVTITEPQGLTATLVATDPTCRDGFDGEVAVTTNGGTPNYLYSADGGTQQSGNILTGLNPGDHTIMVEDNNGCTYTETITLNNPPGIDMISVETSSNCGFNNGALDITASGDNPPFLFSYDDGSGSVPFQSSGTFTNLLAGAYQVYVMDDLGCIDSTYFGINDIEMDGELLGSVDISCYGGSDGQVTVKNLAGAEPITFELNNSGITETGNPLGNGEYEKTFAGLTAGSHIVTIYDDGLCVYTIPFSLDQPDEINFSADITDVACHGESTGEIEVINVTGGTGSYYYSNDGWTFDVNNQFGGFSQGTHTIYVMDDNNCLIAKDFSIDESPLIQVNTSLFDLTCHNDNTGAILVFPTGGTPGYSYSIDNGNNFQASETFMMLDAGLYDVVVRDDANCEMGVQVVIAQPDTVSATFTVTDTQCFGSCDGEITIVAAGGTTPYTFSIDGGTTVNTTGTINNICANNYTFSVKDDKGCTITSDFTINEPTQVTLTSTEVPSTCTNPNGEITITASGGTPNYTYSIDDGNTFQTGGHFTGLMNGSYDLVVEDDHGCIAEGVQMVTDMPSPQIDALFGTQPLCFGSADGEIEVIASGGTGVLMYSVNGGPATTSNILTGLAAGTHTVTIEDENGCTDTQDIVIDEPQQLAITTSSTPLTCFENSTGAVQVTATGGTPTYQYSFDNGANFSSSSTLSFIDAGVYEIVVIDNNGCQVTGSETVTEPSQLVFANITTTDNVCKSACEGEIELTVAGGTAPYTYNWDQPIVGLGPIAGVNDNLATDLCVGSYTFKAIDNNGCEISDVAVITEPDSVEISSINITNVTCHGDCDGEIVVNSPTAVEFSIDGGLNFQTNNTFTGLCAGDYDIVARDGNQCIVEGEANIWQAEPLQATISNDTTVCYAYNLQLIGNATGGIQPYTFNWNGQAGSAFTDTLEIIATSDETHTLEVFDFNGCTVPAMQVEVTVLPQVDMNIVQDTTICPDGTATLTATAFDGLPGYTYEWNTGETTNEINVSPSETATYTVTATDACEDEITQTVTVFIYDLPNPTFIADEVTGCIPQEITFTNTTDPAEIGGDCIWTIDGQQIIDCGEVTFNLTEAKCYNVSLEIESPNGCTNTTTYNEFICLEDYPIADFMYLPAIPTVTNNTVNFSNTSSGATSYTWTAPNQSPTNEVNPTMVFNNVQGSTTIDVCLEASTDYGCADTICKAIAFQEDFAIYVPNSFTPDHDDFNEVFKPVFPPNVDINRYHLSIYNRWGEIMFESFDPNVGWKGTYGVDSEQIVKDGVYVWKISLVIGLNNEAKEFTGHVTLLK